METNKEKTEYAKRLEMLTLHFNMTTRDLANMIGVNENTLYKINCGKSEISERTASRICYQLKEQKGVSVNRGWLLYGEGTMLDVKHNVLPYAADEEHHVAMAAEEPTEFCIDYKAKYFTLLEKYTRLQEEHSELLKKMLQ